MSRLTRRRLLAQGGGLVSIAIGGPVLAGGRRWPWPGGKRAAVSLTYDDGLDSQLDNVLPALDVFGLKATFFLTKENMEARAADWIGVSRRGHEVGDHTTTHPCDNLAAFTAQRFRDQEIAPMEGLLDDGFAAPRPRTFAYPCGFTGLGGGSRTQRRARYLQALEPTFAAARTVDGGPNDPRQVSERRYALNAFEPTYDEDTPRLAADYVQRAIDQGLWAILVFHEVLQARAGDGDTSIAVHRQILQWLVEQPVWCAPMRTVFAAITDEAGVAPHSRHS
jgi:peptidoglycan/xylan/chitin deacetylase (PgdA/CDA1 family)